ncbi:MAG: hypothetical protein RLZZ177_1338 [Pseudomonadota bacterium]|jgi:hypothetical protein
MGPPARPAGLGLKRTVAVPMHNHELICPILTNLECPLPCCDLTFSILLPFACVC